MVTTKKKAAATPKKAAQKQATRPASPEEMVTFDELVASNIAALTQGLAKSTDTTDLLSKKVTSMACHILALESLLSEVIAITGVDLLRVNSSIRSRLAVQADNLTDSEIVVDLAASIASPPRRM